MAFGWPGKGAWGAPGGKAKGWPAKGFPGGGFAPACATKYGPVAKVCKSTVPTTQTVPLAVAKLVPTSTIYPVPRRVTPRTALGKPIPVGATKVPTGGYAKGVPGDFGKAAPWGAAGKGIPWDFGKGMPWDLGKGMPWGAFGKAGPMLDPLGAEMGW